MYGSLFAVLFGAVRGDSHLLWHGVTGLRVGLRDIGPRAHLLLQLVRLLGRHGAHARHQLHVLERHRRQRRARRHADRDRCQVLLHLHVLDVLHLSLCVLRVLHLVDLARVVRRVRVLVPEGRRHGR